MDFIHVTKRPLHSTLDELLALANELEVSGLDMFVRPGYPVEPENVKDRLPEAIKRLAQAHIKVPMVTAPADMVDPDDQIAQQLISACGQVGIGVLKIGYFRPNEMPFWTHMEHIRKCLAKFGELGRRSRVRICYHTHFGCMGNSAAAVMHLLRYLDPQWVGAYLDTAHNHLAGEPIGLAMDTVGTYLTAIGLKDVSYTMVDGRLTAKPCLPPAGEGLLDWPAIFAQIRERQYTGLLSVHCEFNRDTPSQTVEALKKQIVFLRNTAG